MEPRLEPQPLAPAQLERTRGRRQRTAARFDRGVDGSWTAGSRVADEAWPVDAQLDRLEPDLNAFELGWKPVGRDGDPPGLANRRRPSKRDRAEVEGSDRSVELH